MGLARAPLVALALIAGIYVASALDQVDADAFRVGPSAIHFEAGDDGTADVNALRQALAATLRSSQAAVVLRPTAEGLSLAVHDPAQRWPAAHLPFSEAQQRGTARLVSAREGSLLASLEADGVQKSLAADAVIAPYRPASVPVPADYLTTLLGAGGYAGTWAVIGDDAEIRTLLDVLRAGGLTISPITARAPLASVLLTPLGTLLVVITGLALASTTYFWSTHLRQLSRRVQIHRTWGATTPDVLRTHAAIPVGAWLLALAIGTVAAGAVAIQTRLPLGPALTVPGAGAVLACLLLDAGVTTLTYVLTVGALGRQVDP